MKRSQDSDKETPKYTELRDYLLDGLGCNRTQQWLAEHTYVSQEAVSYWLTGRCRPRPERLGFIAALLGLDPHRLFLLAQYRDDPTAYEKLMRAFSHSPSRKPIDIESPQPIIAMEKQ